MKRNSYSKRVGQCEVCGTAIYATREHKRTCSPKCRKKLSRMTNIGAPKTSKGIIRINGTSYEAETGRLWAEVN